jgi:hypothetical protein
VIAVLTELVARQAKPSEKTYLLSDGRGLGLEVRPNGRKYWVIRYWVHGKERRTSVGAYPGVSLREARDKNDDLRRALKAGKPIGFDTETFASVAEEWIEKRIAPSFTAGYVSQMRGRLRKYILPAFGKARLGEITSGSVLRLCR